MKLRILHKGLIILLIPFVLQVFLLCLLYSSYQKIDRLSREETRVSTSVDLLDEIFNQFSLVFQSVWHRFEPSAQKLEPEAFHSRITGLINQERELLSGTPSMLDLLQHVDSFANDCYELLKDIHESGKEESSLQSLFKLEPKAKRLAKQLAFVQSLKHQEFEALRQKREQTREYRARIESQIFMSGIAEIVLTIVLLLFFLNDVSKRLTMLMRNAASIPTGKPLEAKVSGGDELAYLDDVLHGAAEELKRAAQHRNSITQMVSHDLRSPLLASNISLELLLRSDALNSRELHDNRVLSVKRNLSRLMSFVDDLLTIEQYESGRLKLTLEAVELSSMVNDALDDIVELAKEKSLTLKNDVQKLEVVVDKNRLHQVIVNFVSNAIKFSPKRGAIAVSSQTTEKEVRVAVIDQGPGIPEAERVRLFERFQQADSTAAPGGYGLGLFICKMIIERHGGKVGVESKTGQGSSFWFSLPLDE